MILKITHGLKCQLAWERVGLLKRAGTKLSVIVDGDLYALDPSTSLDSAKIKVYDHEDDAWKVVAGDVPIRDFTDSESPYLLGGFLGKLHVITKDANHNIAVMQAERHNDSSSLPSTSSTPLDESSNLAGSESNVWKVIATRRF
ncbi:F-box/kelch-repeat protein [Camellia lanceoleosa]|nr:F-box/kelch-repeat protein [Camellia lanceoleosa]